MFRRIIPYFVFLLPVIAFAEDATPLEEDIRQLVRNLGDESFVVRERAEAQLLRIGIDAYPELQKARTDPDVEIARRAEQILSQFEMLFIGQEHEAVRYWVTYYAVSPGLQEKASVIWLLCDPTSDARGGEGLRTLCRIARFDEQRALRAEAVKGLIASPPLSPDNRRKWYRTLRDSFVEPGEDELLILLSTYASLRCELEERKDAAENEAVENENRTGTPAVFPTPIPPDETLQNRVRKLTDLIAEFQKAPENNAVRVGGRNDILLFYALAELQDMAGLTEDRDRTVAAAQAVRSEDMPGENLVEPESKRAFFEQFMTARILRFRYRIRWAIPLFELVAEHGHVLLRVESYRMLAEVHQMQRRYTEAVGFFDKAIELVQSEDYTSKFSDTKTLVKRFQAGRSLLLGQQAAEANDWDAVKTHVEDGLKNDPHELDILILAWQLGTHQPELRFNDLDRRIDAAIRQVDRKMHEQANPESRQGAAVSGCNQIAWILANTGGDYAVALTLIETALKSEPEELAFIDTLAHVYARGGLYDKAVEAQQRVVRLAPEGVIFHDALDRFRKERDKHSRKERDKHSRKEQDKH